MSTPRLPQPLASYLRLYLILETPMLKVPLEEFIPAVVKGGVTAIQLRDKGCSSRKLYETGIQLKKLLADKDVLFIMNDRADLALALGTHGVHIGVKDIPLPAVKASFPGLITGYSCNNEEDLDHINAQRPSYIGVGPAFFTSTKDDLRAIISPVGIGSIVRRTTVPAVAIGGINAENVLKLEGLGLAGVAVSSAICAAPNPEEAARTLRALADKL